MNYYVDTAIWRDYYENRHDRFRPLGEWALAFFKKVIQNGDTIFYSEAVVKELGAQYSGDEINRMLDMVCAKKIMIQRAHVQQAAKISRQQRLPFGDALHAVLAHECRAVLVSRDRHFYEMDFIVVKKPEELL